MTRQCYKSINELGACLEQSPKYHCEITGEGVECCWENTKLLYRRTPNYKRSTNQDFLKALKEETIWICLE